MCRYCENVASPCLSHFKVWVCCRPKGHAGNHAACGGKNQHPIIMWRRDNKLIEKLQTYYRDRAKTAWLCGTSRNQVRVIKADRLLSETLNDSMEVYYEDEN